MTRRASLLLIKISDYYTDTAAQTECKKQEKMQPAEHKNKKKKK